MPRWFVEVVYRTAVRVNDTDEERVIEDLVIEPRPVHFNFGIRPSWRTVMQHTDLQKVKLNLDHPDQRFGIRRRVRLIGQGPKLQVLRKLRDKVWGEPHTWGTREFHFTNSNPDNPLELERDFDMER